ncbi:MAG: tetratricopeptide repeat protein [Opitutaceae bacterium]|nr:tetratricopeptide repeat protein [Opitutaceae bacterium]
MSGCFDFAHLTPRCTALACALMCVTVARAHPEIENGLAELNPRIEATPNDAAQYLDRGELYARHADWIQAEANYLRAAELSPRLPGLDRARGALALRIGNPREAGGHFARALALDPRDAETFILRNRARVALGDRAGALADLQHALRLIESPRPELFLERAALIAAARDAVRSLDDGIARIGPVHTLQLRAFQLEESAGLIDAALARLSVIAAQSERKEIWLKRRGDVLMHAGRIAEARAAYGAALAAINSLPAWLRESPDSATLATELARLSGRAS